MPALPIFSTPAPAGRMLRRDLSLAVSLVAVALLELAGRGTGLAFFRHLAWLAMAAVVLGSLGRIGLRERYLLVVSATLSGLALWRASAPWQMLGGALDQATFLMAFILLLGLLHETAATSPSVAACGEYLTRQPPGRRYYALNVGTGALAVLFNLGVVSFLVPLIQNGIEKATPGDALNPVREQRQISAMLRGFAWSVIWSPTAMAPLVLMELIPGVNRLRWIEYGLGVFVLILILGAFEDRLRFRRYRPVGRRQAAPFPTLGALRFAAACAWLFGMTGAAMVLSGNTILFGLMLSCPVMMLGWLAVQFGVTRPGTAGQVRARVAQILGRGVPKGAPVAITLACSGYIGVVAASLIPARALAQALNLDAVPHYLLLSALPPLLALVSLLALSPIMLAVFFGSLFAALPKLPADPTLIAFALSCGWALSMTGSPFATVVLMIDRVGGIPPRRTTWAWNLGFTVLCALVMVPIFWALTGGR
mgnify:CR=1 FL=1